jgi:ribosomal protein L44E
MGGTNEPSNIVELTVEEHAEAHRVLYEKYGAKEDYLAWKGLAGLISKEEIIYEALKLAGIKGNSIHVERLKNDPEYAAEVKRKQRKPKSTTENMKGPKSEEHRKNQSKAALKRPRFPCSKCGKGITKANLKKHEDSCSD